MKVCLHSVKEVQFDEVFDRKNFKSSKQCEIRILNYFGQKIREILFTLLQCNLRNVFSVKKFVKVCSSNCTARMQCSLTNFLTEIFQNFKALKEIRILNFFGQKIREILFTFLQCNTEIFQNFKALRN